MGTPAERKALGVLAALLLLGASVQAAQAHRLEGAALPSGPQPALDAQLAAIDSARLRQGHRNRSLPAARAPERPAVGVWPPGTAAPRSDPRPAVAVVNVDAASEAQIELLPGIGPALAKRIVADRNRHGPFGSAEVLQRVKGIGPGTVRKLAGRISFGRSP